MSSFVIKASGSERPNGLSQLARAIWPAQGIEAEIPEGFTEGKA
jgi:hypothetical protein